MNNLAGIAAFRVRSSLGVSTSGLYEDSSRRVGDGAVYKGYYGLASIAFGLLGLCFDARMGRATFEDAALQLQETLLAFDQYV